MPDADLREARDRYHRQGWLTSAGVYDDELRRRALLACTPRLRCLIVNVIAVGVADACMHAVWARQDVHATSSPLAPTVRRQQAR